MPCPTCGGRTLKSETGERCLNPKCSGATVATAEKTVNCGCGEAMNYQGLNNYGEPLYKCFSCGRTTKL